MKNGIECRNSHRRRPYQFLHPERRGRCEEGALVAGIVGAIVVKVTDNIVAKWGWTVSAVEAAIQEFAYNHLDKNVVRISKVYHSVQDDEGRG
jgi:hypothetical protein